MPLFPSLRRPLFCLLPAALVFSACSTASRVAPAPGFPALAAPATPAGVNAFPRWQARFDEFQHALASVDYPLFEAESADGPSPDIPASQLAPALDLLKFFTLAPGEALVLPPIHGPETPFPEHQALRQIANLRTVQARRAIAVGDTRQALSLIRQNLAQARATLVAQEGLLPLIHAAGVWQCALDGAHALARCPALSKDDARSLLAELQADAGLACAALDRAFRGEYLYVYRVIVERLPRTDDPDLLLSAVASLGMSKPEPLAPGEIGLGLTEHVLLDPAATFAAYETDLAPYLATLASSPRYPRDLYEQRTAPTLKSYRAQLGAFYDYASSDGSLPLDFVLRARAAMESTPNPVGKLLAIYLTPQWDMMISTTFRRDAQRSAVIALLAWRIHGKPAPWDELVAAGVLPAPPVDPFSNGALRYDAGENARVWSISADGEDNGGKPVAGNLGLPADLVWLR